LGPPHHHCPTRHLPDPRCHLADDLFPEDLPRLLGLLERADLYLQDEVEVALDPTLTRVWSRSGRAGQRRVQAPGTIAKQYGFGLVDWREGYLDWALADGRRAVPFCEQLRRAVARSRSRGRPLQHNAELAATLEDIRAMALLGKYYAAKIRGAAELALFRASRRPQHQTLAVRHLTHAAGHWKEYTSRTGARYRNPLWTNRVGLVDWRELDAEVARDIEIARASLN